MQRASGILLHPTSLPAAGGIGDLGPEAYRFADWLEAAGQRIWQVLPLGPVGYGESPYQLFSAFAGNPLLIALEDAPPPPAFARDRVEFERVAPWKMERLREAFRKRGPETAATDDGFEWLETFARFMALKTANGGKPWWEWDARAQPDPEEIEFQKFLQRTFFRQWRALQTYCHDRGVHLMGDLPIYVAKDSADVWARPELFDFDCVASACRRITSAPPGSCGAIPIYRWKRMAADRIQLVDRPHARGAYPVRPGAPGSLPWL